jgi:hypothetical protein
MRDGSHHGTVTCVLKRSGNLIRRAANPAGSGAEFPRMLYRGAEQRIVNDEAEQQTAESAGFGCTPPPPYEEGFRAGIARNPPRWAAGKFMTCAECKSTTRNRSGNFLP